MAWFDRINKFEKLLILAVLAMTIAFSLFINDWLVLDLAEMIAHADNRL